MGTREQGALNVEGRFSPPRPYNPQPHLDVRGYSPFPMPGGVPAGCPPPHRGVGVRREVSAVGEGSEKRPKRALLSCLDSALIIIRVVKTANLRNSRKGQRHPWRLGSADCSRGSRAASSRNRHCRLAYRGGRAWPRHCRRRCWSSCCRCGPRQRGRHARPSWCRSGCRACSACPRPRARFPPSQSGNTVYRKPPLRVPAR